MIFTAITELNEVLIRNPLSNYGRLQLDDYLVMVAENDETDDCLACLEDNGHLPLTVAWFSQGGYKVRLYQRAEGIQTGEVFCLGLSMTVLTGADARCLVASPLVRLRDYDDLEDESLVQEEPAALNRQALKVLQSLFHLDDCLSFNTGGNNLQAI
jgi:hypothetical protein